MHFLAKPRTAVGFAIVSNLFDADGHVEGW
jgi:hypothetical protein